LEAALAMPEALPDAGHKTVGLNIDGRTTHHSATGQPGVRTRIEEADGGIKQVGGMAQTKLRGVQRVARVFVFKAAAHN
jgi:hypothetical protein